MPNSQLVDRHWEQNRELLIEAARNAGVDPALLVKISGFESGFDTHARPVNRRQPERNTVHQFDGTMALSSAYGLGQFTNGTWHDSIRRYGAKYGVAGAAHLSLEQANSVSLRDNPRLQAAMLAEFTRDNIVRGQRLGGADSAANVYALHNLGSGDGPRFLEALRANPNAAVDSVLSTKVIRGNPALYGDGGRTLAEAYRVMGAKMEDYSKYAEQVHRATPRPAQPSNAAAQSPLVPPAPSSHANAAIYNEARLHFLNGHDHFEYGRGDVGRMSNRGGDRRTDQSRNERDLDGDGRKGIDCSSFVWRGLRSAGYDVPDSPFTSHDLFNGSGVTPYSRRHFDVIAAADASHRSGALIPGDVLLFKDRGGPGQHVGIFKDYDAKGHIRFIGSQVTTGPAEAGAAPGSYWNGRDFEIVGALRAKPEFQVRAPLHSEGAAAVEPRHTVRAPPAQPASENPSRTSSTATNEHLRQGGSGPAVVRLQRRLTDLGYRGEDDRPLGVDGKFGENTKFALQAFQREHGLLGLGVAGPKTEAALDRAERALMSHASHSHNALYAQVLEKLHTEERCRGMPTGHHSERIAAALAVECLREGITRVDRVELNRDASIVRAVQASPMRDEPGLNRTTDGISPAQAARQPMLESSEQMHQVAVNRQAHQYHPQQAHARLAVALSH